MFKKQKFQDFILTGIGHPQHSSGEKNTLSYTRLTSILQEFLARAKINHPEGSGVDRDSKSRSVSKIWGFCSLKSFSKVFEVRVAPDRPETIRNGLPVNGEV